MSQTTGSSTTREPLCHSVKPKEQHQLADDTLLGDILDQNGIPASCLPTQKRVSVAKLTGGRYNDKLNRAMQSLPQPQLLRAQTHCLPVTPICQSPTTNTALHCLGRGNTLKCSYSTKYFNLISLTYLAILTQSSSHLEEQAIHSLLARCYWWQASSPAPIAFYTPTPPL